MKTRRVLLVTTLTLALLFAFAASAFAAVIPAPTAGYLADTTKIDLTPYYWNGAGWPPPPVPAISDGTLTVAFSAPQMFGAYKPETLVHANAWGDDGVVESTTPMPGRTNSTTYAYGQGPAGPQTITLTLSELVKTFGFEAASNAGAAPGIGYTATVTFKRGGATIDTITKVIPAQTFAPGPYQAHAQFFAATDATGFDEVVFTASALPPAAATDTGIFIAQYRYDLPDPPPPVVSTSASSAWSLLVLAAAGVALFAVGRKKYLANH
jgi:hypothetical protein